jgi:hypothetical protein
MAMTEVDLAMGVSFSATNAGQGSVSQSFVLYSFGNSTSLASVASISGSSSWSTGTAAASAPWTSIQGGWSGNLIHPITFASTSLNAGEYIVGHLFELSMANSGHSAAIYGDVGMLSSAVTAFSAAPTAASAFSTGGISSASAFSATSNITVNSEGLTGASAFTGTTNITLSSMAVASFGSALRLMSYGTSTDAVTMGGTASASAISGFSKAATASFNSLAGSYINGTTAQTALSAAGYKAGSIITGTTAATALSASGYVTGSIISSTAGVNAISNGSTAAMTLGYPAVLSFGFVGTASASTNMNIFIAGIMSTGAAPASIALTNTALTYGGSACMVQPWFQLAGS